jgi:hypothetical protein
MVSFPSPTRPAPARDTFIQSLLDHTYYSVPDMAMLGYFKALGFTAEAGLFRENQSPAILDGFSRI